MTEEEKGQLMADYREVFNSPAGQRVLADMMRLAGLYKTTDVSDAIAMAEQVGRQNLIKEIVVLHGVGLDVFYQHLRKGSYERDGSSNGHDNSEWV